MNSDINWENLVEKPIPMFRAESKMSFKEEEIKRESALFRAKVAADLKRLQEKVNGNMERSK